MTAAPLYLRDPSCRQAAGVVSGHTPEGGVIVTPALFYPTGGGQPGDSGRLTWPGGALEVATTVKGEGGASVLVPAEPQALPPVGMPVTQILDWERRHKHMRIHSALHLLSVVVPLPVTGGQVDAGKGRLDFLMPEPPSDREGLEAALNLLVERDLPITEDWITEAELDAKPEMVKTMSVQPPRGVGPIRLVRIGSIPAPVDLQPCGGTHVARTSEIGPLRIRKIEKKGRENRRIGIELV